MSDDRTCSNCACVFHVEKPRIMPASMTKEEWDKLPDMWVCRLDPPFPAQTEKGVTLVQRATAPNLVCWHWVTPGTQPGDQRALANIPPIAYCEAELIDGLNRRHVCKRTKGHGGLHAGDGASW